MKALVTGGAGFIGSHLVDALVERGDDVVVVDNLSSGRRENLAGAIGEGAELVEADVTDAAAIADLVEQRRPEVVFHLAAQIDVRRSVADPVYDVNVNVAGTLNLLEAAVETGVARFVFTSTTSTFGRALVPADGEPAAWITEDVMPVPKNIYGATKVAAEDLCELVHRDHGLPVLILRTSRFFPEADDRDDVRTAYADANLKVNELLYRRVDLQDVVDAHRLALDRAAAIGFGRYIVSATTPFTRRDLAGLRRDAPAVVERRLPGAAERYAALGWTMFPSIERVYVNDRARAELGWTPRYDFAHALDRLAAGDDFRSPLALEVGAKGYHEESTGVYTTR